MWEVIVTFKDGSQKSYKSDKPNCHKIRFAMCSIAVCKKAFGEMTKDVWWYDPANASKRGEYVHEHYGADIVYRPLDGRSNYAKTLKYYTVNIY